jgi:TolB-like protein/Flp pilus assembly protein TadD/predicted Ser/Thr protein kinase
LILEPQSTLAHYRILEKIGEGGMGVVYRALDTKLERDVALKVLRAEMASDPERFTRFEREARALASLTHPNIGAIYQIDEVEGVAFIVMEMIEGQTLRQRIGGRPLPVEVMLDLALQIADALDAAHARGIVHRDIKPSNILITDRGRVKMLDFGLAKLTRPGDDSGEGSSRLETAHMENRHLTTPGSTMGTIAYMSPEQVRGEEIDARTDLFSFGAVLYEMATGRCAFSAHTSGLTFDAILNRTPTPPDQINPDIPGRLVQIFDRALEKDRSLRYQSAADLRADLARVRRDTDSGRVALQIDTTPPGDQRRAPGPPRWIVSRLWTAAAALALVAAGTAAGLYLRRSPNAVIDSVAVLPFEYAGDRQDGEYLSDGVTEALINGLSKIPDLRVVPRSLVFTYKGKPVDPGKVGRELKVSAVVTGRVAQRGVDLTVSAELIDARTIAQIWGEQYARAAADIVSVSEEIARDISQRLRPTLTQDVEQRIARRYTENPDAFAHYARSLQQVSLGTRAEFGRAIAEAEKALVEDLRQRALLPGPGASGTPPGQKEPGYALAYARLARLYTRQAYLGFDPSEEDHAKAKSAADFALQMDETLAPAQDALAFVKFFYEWDWPAAERGFRKALRLGPDDDETRRDYAWFLMAMGRTQEAVDEMRRACDLNPESGILSAQLAEHLFWAGRYDDAVAELERTRRLAPASASAALVAACIQSRRGRHADAIASYLDYQVLVEEESTMSPPLALFYAAAGKRDEAAAILRRTAPGGISAAQMGWVYAALGDKDQAFKWLGRAIDQHAANMIWIRSQPWFDPLRSDPRFPRLLRRMNLAP